MLRLVVRRMIMRREQPVFIRDDMLRSMSSMYMMDGRRRVLVVVLVVMLLCRRPCIVYMRCISQRSGHENVCFYNDCKPYRSNQDHLPKGP